MGKKNNNLTAARKEKNDEFYTQYIDIQKEMEAYLEYNPNVFRGKIVYCNCDDPFESNFFRYFVLNFNKIGLKRLITTSYKSSPFANTQLDLKESSKSKTTANKFIINNVNNMSDGRNFSLADVSERLKANKENEWSPLCGDGDFRSEECIQLLEQADIVITNPPFSLFRDFVKQMMETGKQFAIIGNMNAITYKEVFPLIRENKIWLGATGNGTSKAFMVPDHFPVKKEDKTKASKNGLKGNYTWLGNTCWFTNIEHGRCGQELPLMSIHDNLKFSKHKELAGRNEYTRYDNYDAIEVPYTDAIPSDYQGIMGVPISFLAKHNPNQFEIVGITKTWFGSATKTYKEQTQVNSDGSTKKVMKLNDGPSVRLNGTPTGETHYVVDGVCYKQLYARVLIKHKKV